MKRLLISAIFVFAIVTSSLCTGAQEPTVPAASKSTWVVGGQMYVVIPADRKSIFAFSTATSRLSRLTLDTPLPDDAKPVIASNVAAIQAGRTVYAIGATGNRWARLDLPADGLHFVVDSESIRVSDDDVFYIFASGSTDWVGVDLNNGAVLTTGDGG
ncbi:hypothetical protein Pla52o_57470 [Novipirellula galeiformis]|uniref:Uncharacterized protein n=1 Tax=Novipirellula galeiformis TaxID=2528004 RepID=A0A5C6BFL6_9BACT|nr:hypothetical protein [Novipirellula galeiformis]TWU10291.1 hypothetical protein Pla52o_57470 [Novipirellula galeiformis]